MNEKISAYVGIGSIVIGIVAIVAAVSFHTTPVVDYTDVSVDNPETVSVTPAKPEPVASVAKPVAAKPMAAKPVAKPITYGVARVKSAYGCYWHRSETTGELIHVCDSQEWSKSETVETGSLVSSYDTDLKNLREGAESNLWK